MELSESNITEFVLVSHAEPYLNRFLTASYKILKHFAIISEFCKYFIGATRGQT
jgi:hypothetical protein